MFKEMSQRVMSQLQFYHTDTKGHFRLQLELGRNSLGALPILIFEVLNTVS